MQMTTIMVEFRTWVLPYLVIFALVYLVTQSNERLLVDHLERVEAQLETNTAVLGSLRDLLSYGGYIVPPTAPTRFPGDAE